MLSTDNRAKEREKSLKGKLPAIPSKQSEQNAVEYVALVYEGCDKAEAFQKIFPEQYKNAVEFAHARGRDERAMVMARVSKYEQGKYVSEVYKLGRDDYWKKFIHKKTRLLNKAYDMAMDDVEGKEYSERTQLMAMKTFLDNVPDMAEDKTINVKHHISADTEFLQKIQQRKQALLNSVDEIVDVEVSDHGL